MTQHQVTSRCECQATLGATLDGHRQVIEGWARRFEVVERAPAMSLNAELDRYDVAWECPFCGRNTMRSFVAERP